MSDRVNKAIFDVMNNWHTLSEYQKQNRAEVLVDALADMSSRLAHDWRFR